MAHRVPVAVRDPRTGRVRIVEEAAETPVRVPYMDAAMTDPVRVALGGRTASFRLYGRALWQAVSCLPSRLGTPEGDSTMTFAPYRPHLGELLLGGWNPAAARVRPDPEEAAALRLVASDAVRRAAAHALAHDGTYLYRRLPRPVLIAETTVASLHDVSGLGGLYPGVPPELIPAYREVAPLLAPFGTAAAIPAGERGSMERAWAKFEREAGMLPADDEWVRRIANVLPRVLIEALQDPRQGRLAGEAARQVGRLAPFLARGALGALPDDHLPESLSACAGAATALSGMVRKPVERNRYAYLAAFVERIALPALWSGRTLAREDADELSALAP